MKQATRIQEALAARRRLRQLPGYLALKARALASKANLELERFDAAMLDTIWTGALPVLQRLSIASF